MPPSGQELAHEFWLWKQKLHDRLNAQSDATTSWRLHAVPIKDSVRTELIELIGLSL